MNRRLSIAAFVILALLVGGGLCVRFLSGFNDSGLEPLEREASDNLDSPIPKDNGSRTEPIETGNSDSQQVKGKDSDEPNPTAQPAVRVRVIGPDGAPVPRLVLMFHQHGINDEATTTTDDDGHAILLVRSARDTTHVESKADTWLMSEQVQSVEGQVTTLHTVPCITILLSAVCDRGEPWADAVYMRSGQWGVDPEGIPASNRPAGDWERTVRLSAEHPTEVTKLPLGSDLRLWFREYVPGVEEQWHTLRLVQAQHQESVVITLARNPNPKTGAVEIDLTDYPGAGGRITLHREGWGTQSGGASIPRGGFPQGKWMSRPMLPGKYVAKIEGDLPWESAFEIVAGEVTRLSVQIAALGRIEVRVLDQEFAPVEGAVLSTASGEYFVWSAARRASDAFTDDQGIAVLTDRQPGAYRLLVEAVGYEPHFIDVVLAPNEHLMLGDVVLQPAVGRIEITLEGFDPDKSYTVLLLQPGGQTVRSVKNVETDTVVFSELPQRVYVVAVIVGRGGKPASASADITTAPEAIVKLDVSGLKGEAADPKDTPD